MIQIGTVIPILSWIIFKAYLWTNSSAPGRGGYRWSCWFDLASKSLMVYGICIDMSLRSSIGTLSRQICWSTTKGSFGSWISVLPAPLRTAKRKIRCSSGPSASLPRSNMAIGKAMRVPIFIPWARSYSIWGRGGDFRAGLLRQRRLYETKGVNV
ncbi:hypothetical protein D3C81_1560600 [compost metagenome]